MSFYSWKSLTIYRRFLLQAYRNSRILGWPVKTHEPQEPFCTPPQYLPEVQECAVHLEEQKILAAHSLTRFIIRKEVKIFSNHNVHPWRVSFQQIHSIKKLVNNSLCTLGNSRICVPMFHHQSIKTKVKENIGTPGHLFLLLQDMIPELPWLVWTGQTMRKRPNLFKPIKECEGSVLESPIYYKKDKKDKESHAYFVF